MSKSVYSARYKAFLRLLKLARLQSGLTQVDVAAKLQMPQSFVSKCESGERRVDVIELLSFAEIYQKPLIFFIPGESEGNSEGADSCQG